MNDDAWKGWLDAWKTTEPPEAPSPTTKYRCLDCDWSGSGGLAAMRHHRGTRHHRIVARDAPQWGPLKFACCAELAAPDEPEITPIVKENVPS